MDDEEKKNIREKRRNIIKNSKTTIIKKGDRRIQSSTRICAICGRSLSTYIYKDGSTQASENHIHCYISDLMILNLCKDIRSCYSTIKNRRDV